jgi:hypothetical protein
MNVSASSILLLRINALTASQVVLEIKDLRSLHGLILEIFEILFFLATTDSSPPMNIRIPKASSSSSRDLGVNVMCDRFLRDHRETIWLHVAEYICDKVDEGLFAIVEIRSTTSFEYEIF